MTITDDDRPARNPAHEIGQDLSTLSVAELEARVALLEEEIRRLREAAAAKTDSRAAAESFFRTT